MFSGPIGAYAYKATAREDFDVAVLVGPSHFVAFDGVALWPDGAFDSPLGPARIDEAGARPLAASPIVQPLPSAHRRRHFPAQLLPFLPGALLGVSPHFPLIQAQQLRTQPP